MEKTVAYFTYYSSTRRGIKKTQNLQWRYWVSGRISIRGIPNKKQEIQQLTKTNFSFPYAISILMKNDGSENVGINTPY
jgi:hypothetical protein